MACGIDGQGEEMWCVGLMNKGGEGCVVWSKDTGNCIPNFSNSVHCFEKVKLKECFLCGCMCVPQCKANV